MSRMVPNVTRMTTAKHEFRLPVVAMLIDSGISTFHSLQWGSVLFWLRHIQPAPRPPPPPAKHTSSQPAFVQLNLLLLSFLPSLEHTVQAVCLASRS